MTNFNDTTITPQACRVISECRYLVNRTRATWGNDIADQSMDSLVASLGAIFGIAQSGAQIIATDTYGIGVQVNETDFYAEMVATPVRSITGWTDEQIDEYGRPYTWSVHS